MNEDALIRGGRVPGCCAICHHEGPFVARDVIELAGYKLFTHPVCRQNWTAVHKLEQWLLFGGEYQPENPPS